MSHLRVAAVVILLLTPSLRMHRLITQRGETVHRTSSATSWRLRPISR